MQTESHAYNQIHIVYDFYIFCSFFGLLNASNIFLESPLGHTHS